MKAERIDHIHVYVRDLEKAKQFFEDILGTKFSGPLANDVLNSRAVFEPLGLELLAPTSADGLIAKTLEQRGEGIAGVSFKVSNLEEATAKLQSRGVRLVGRVERGKIKEAQFHPKDCFGVLIELCEYEEKHRALTAAEEGSPATYIFRSGDPGMTAPGQS